MRRHPCRRIVRNSLVWFPANNRRAQPVAEKKRCGGTYKSLVPRQIPIRNHLTRASPALQRRVVGVSSLSGHGSVAREDILSNRSRGILPRRFFRIVPSPKAVGSSGREGGRSKTARLRSWPPERRSGWTSAEPDPPSGSGLFWPCDGSSCKRLPCENAVSSSPFRTNSARISG